MNPDAECDIREMIWGVFEANRDIVLAKLDIKSSINQLEAVHQLRVAIKKIRTIFRLAEFMDLEESLPKKELRKLRSLFRDAGVLREVQVHQEVLDGYEILQLRFLRKLSKQLLAERRAAQPIYEHARNHFERKNLEKLGHIIQKRLNALEPDFVLAKVKAFSLLRLHTMQATMPNRYEPEMIHKTRILLKEAMYLLGLIQSSAGVAAIPIGLLDDAKAAAEFAGDWHDQEVFCQWLQLQMRPGAAIGSVHEDYRILLQDLHVHTHNQVVRFRKSLLIMIDVAF